MRKLIYLLGFTYFLVSCSKEHQKDPAVQTLPPIVTSGFTFTATGNIQEVGSYAVYDYGFVFGGSQNLDIYYGDTISLGKSPKPGNYQKDIVQKFDSYVNYGYPIYYRAYLTNSKGTVYGKVFSVHLAPVNITSINPMSGKVGDHITITGSGFSPVAAYNNVEFNGAPAVVTKATTTQLTVTVPNGINSYYYSNQVEITIQTETGPVYATYYFQIIPTVTGMSPSSGTFGTSVTLTGTGFSAYNYYTIAVGNTTAQGYSNGSYNMTFTIPSEVNSEQLSVSFMYNNSLQPIGTFTMNKPKITSFTPASGSVGTWVTVYGQNFNNGYYNTVTIGGVSPYLYYSSSTQLQFYVPSLSPGTYSISVNNGITTAVSAGTFTVQ